MRKSIIISCVLTLVSLALGCYMLFVEVPEYEYFLITETVSVLLFAVAVVTLIFCAVSMKTEQSVSIKRVYTIIVSFLVIITVLYIPCAYISCYDEYTPEKDYVYDKEYIQQFLPISNVNEIETRDDLMQSMLLYTNYPGFSELSVVDMHLWNRYDLLYIKSMNPIYNLRAIRNIKFTLKTEAVNGEWKESIYNVDGTEVYIYSNSKDRYGCIKNYGRIMTVFTENCKDIFVTEEAFAEYLCNQYKLADECMTSKRFRDASWYNVPFYVRAWSEPYENLSCFS